MIEFNCVCKQHKFSLLPDMAGTLAQCPVCRRLVDVPTLDELAHIDADGGYKFEGESQSKKLDAQVALRAFSKQRVDEYGDEIDMRQTFEEIQRAGVHHVPGTLDGVRPIPPKYDPVTGELIRPLGIKNETPKRVLPVAPASDEPIDAVPIPAPKISYSVIPPADISLGGVFIGLLQPANLVVMAFILLMHLFLHITAAIVVMGFFFVFVAPIILVMGLIGHYGNVIDEIGPGGRDDLPAPLRDASFYDDMWRPFTQVLMSLLIAFLPLLISQDVSLPVGFAWLVQVICVVAGMLAAPALLLTAVTSGTYLNLRPDRVTGVIAICASRYAVTCATFAVGGVLYYLGLNMIGEGTQFMVHFKSIGAGLAQLAMGYAVLAGAIYVTHAFCWQLGLIYRTYHQRFPWVLQRHVPVRMAHRTRSHPGQLPPMK